MHCFSILLTSVGDVNQFVDAASRLPCDVDVRSGRYLVNGKSIMGLFSIDLSAPVLVEVRGERAECDELRQAMSKFIAEA